MNKLPSQINKERLDRLSREFTPSQVSYLIAPNINCSMEQCVEAVADALERLEKFVKNGNSDEGLDFKYKKITHI